MSEYSYVVGPIKNNQQSVSIMNRESGAGQVVISTPEKVDEYVSSMKKAPMQDEFKALGIISATSIAGYFAGALAKTKDIGLIGAFAGAIIGYVGCVFIPSKQNKLTEEFIKNNTQAQ